MQDIILGIDPGTFKSGLVILGDTQIIGGDNPDNEDLFTLLDKYTLLGDGRNSITVVYEDIRPYTSRFNMDTINTCKMIGRLEYVLNQRKVAYRAVARNEVKAYVFNNYYSLVVEDIVAKIARKERITKLGKAYKPSFQYVDDRMVVKAMKSKWDIKKPKPGQKNELGIREHVWQALGAVTCYLHKLESASSGIF